MSCGAGGVAETAGARTPPPFKSAAATSMPAATGVGVGRVESDVKPGLTGSASTSVESTAPLAPRVALSPVA